MKIRFCQNSSFLPNSSFSLYEDSSLQNSAVHSSERNISANCVNNFSHSLKCEKSNNKREKANVSQEITRPMCVHCLMKIEM